MSSVSVIVPNYNHAPYLPLRLKSILDQTFPDFDLLILDDCSSDASREVISAFTADSRVRTDFNERNSGNTYLQWRKGLELTRGEYVWVAESDDFADPRFLERLVPLLSENPCAGLAFCETTVINENGGELGWYAERSLGGYQGKYGELLDREFLMDGCDYVRSMMFPWNTIPNASAVLFRRAAIERAGGPVASMRVCGDWLLYCKILSQWDVTHVPERLNYFRYHEVNVRSKVRRAALAREWLDVAVWIEREIGGTSRPARREASSYVAEVLLGIDRSEGDGRVPAGRMPGALVRAGQMSPRLLLPTATSLARQLVGDLF